MTGVESWHKWLIVASWLFLVSSAFSLAKTIRDTYEADRAPARPADDRLSA